MTFRSSPETIRRDLTEPRTWAVGCSPAARRDSHRIALRRLAART